MAIQLRDADGDPVVVQEGESCNIVTGFRFADVVNKEALLTLTLTLYDDLTNTKINSRLNQSVLDQNGGSVTSEGVWTQKLDPLDNVMVSTDQAQETHVLRAKWTWNDGVDTRTGIEELSFVVERLAVVT